MPPELFFAGPGIDRADRLRGDPAAIPPGGRRLRWIDGAPALDSAGRLCWDEGPAGAPLFLGLGADGQACHSALADDSPADPRAHFGLLAQLDPRDAPLFAAALSLANWHRRHGYCAACGAATAIVRGGWGRACPDCATEHFPRVDPVAIMLVEHDDRLLLGRQPHYPPGRYSALAGFIEPGETIEAAVAREVMEEAGIAVAEVRYVASQPWPFPSSLMIGMHARALEDRLTVDTAELDDARWFSRAEVAAAIAGQGDSAFLPPPHFAIARTLLEHWLEVAPPAA